MAVHGLLCSAILTYPEGMVSDVHLARASVATDCCAEFEVHLKDAVVCMRRDCRCDLGLVGVECGAAS